MPELASWLKNAYANFIYEALPIEAANTFVEILTWNPCNPSFHGHLRCLAAIAWDVSDSRGQIKIVNLLVAIPNLRYGMKKGGHSKHEMDLRGETELTYVLDEFSLSILDVHGVLSPIRGLNIVTPDSNDQWINVNAFLGRLTAANTCHVGMKRVGYLCDSFIRDDDVRENAVILNVSVSATAQHMIYSASKVFKFCEQEFTLMLGHVGWKKWMAGFKEAQTNPLIDTSGKKHARLAVAAMTEVELSWERRHMLCCLGGFG